VLVPAMYSVADSFARRLRRLFGAAEEGGLDVEDVDAP